MRSYILDKFGRGVIEMIRPSKVAPPPAWSPMQNSPKQSITTMPYPREAIDFSQAGPVLELVAHMHYLETVQQIPVRQPGYILRAAPADVGPARADIPDQRLGIMQYPPDQARDSYVIGAMSAPARLQSVPGYTVKQTMITKTSQGYPGQALKAPRPNSGGGQCRDE